MAVLTNADRADISQDVARSLATVTYDKPRVFAAIQAVEDWFEANRASLNSAINAATGSSPFTVAQKKLIVAYWLRYKFGKER